MCATNQDSLVLATLRYMKVFMIFELIDENISTGRKRKSETARELESGPGGVQPKVQRGKRNSPP